MSKKELLNDKRKAKSIIAGPLVLVLVSAPASVVLTSCFKIADSVKAYSRRYSLNEIRIAESNTFRKLNNVTYPDEGRPTKNKILDEEVLAYSNFSNLTYHSLINASKKDNMSFSLMSLYSVMNEMTNAVSRDDLKDDLNNLLGLDETLRVSFYDKVIKANSYAVTEATTQIKNAAFFNNEYDYSQDFVNSLTRLYCEAYQLDIDTDWSKIVDWVNQAVDSKGYINKDFLEIDDETELFLFSTYYFKHAWANKYLSKNNVKDNFYLSNGNKIMTTYMRHSYNTESYYDYGKYISVKDYYLHGYASVTYLIPKLNRDNIFELTENTNIFIEDEDKIVLPEKGNNIQVNLKTPKFKSKSEIDLKQCLTNLGFGDMFNRNVDSFKNAFSDEDAGDVNFYIQKIKQKNEVEFNEDGSTVKSVTMTGFGGAKSANFVANTLDVNLDQPFIYIIRDINDTPIFVGHIDNPKL